MRKIGTVYLAQIHAGSPYDGIPGFDLATLQASMCRPKHQDSIVGSRFEKLSVWEAGDGQLLLRQKEYLDEFISFQPRYIFCKLPQVHINQPILSKRGTKLTK